MKKVFIAIFVLPIIIGCSNKENVNQLDSVLKVEEKGVVTGASETTKSEAINPKKF